MAASGGHWKGGSFTPAGGMKKAQRMAKAERELQAALDQFSNWNRPAYAPTIADVHRDDVR